MIQLFDRYWIALAIIVAIAALPLRLQAGGATIIISEIAWAGSSLSSADEWIELTNLTAETIDVSGWIIKGAGSSDKDITIPSESMIQPYSAYLIANYENTHENSALAITPNFVTTTLSLSNDGFLLSLFDDEGALIDVAGGHGAPFAGRSGGSQNTDDGQYTTMVRTEELSDGSLAESWTDAQTSDGYKEGLMNWGTPGVALLIFDEVDEEATGGDTPEVAEETVVEETMVEQTTIEEITSEEEKEADEIMTQEMTESGDGIEEEQAEEVVENSASSAASDLQTIPPDAVIINEFVVDPPADGVEWIELMNRSDVQITLWGWTIVDEAGGETALSSVTIEANSYAVIESPKGKLNNQSDAVVLKDANGTIIESVHYGEEGYPAPKDGEALARNGANFEITEQPTPGSKNVIVVTVKEIEQVDEEMNTSTGTNESSATNSDSATYTILKTLRFSGLYPNTTNSDEEEEYIEVSNMGDEAVDLLGWSIKDASGESYTISESRVLDGSESVRLWREQTNIALNNDGDTLEFIAPDNEVVDKVTYTDAQKGAEYQLAEGSWSWFGIASAETTPSTVVVANTSASPTTNTTATQSSTQINQSITIEQAQQQSDGKRVTLKGIVTVTPGNFSSQTFYLQDDTGGMQVYLHSGAFPELDLGAVVGVKGEMSTSHGERRVKLDTETDITITNESSVLEAVEYQLTDMNERLVGSLIQTTGQVQSKTATKLVIEASGSTLAVYLKSDSMIDPNTFERGDRIRMVGVLTIYDGELRIRPRSEQDMTIEETADEAIAAMDTTEIGRGSRAGIILLMSVIAALGILALRQFIPRGRVKPLTKLPYEAKTD